jgi:hypothetical protein
MGSNTLQHGKAAFMSAAADARALWQQVVPLVRKHGIPMYLAGWKYTGKECVDDMWEIAQRLKEYHHHSFLADKNGVPVNSVTQGSAPRHRHRHRHRPEHRQLQPKEIEHALGRDPVCVCLPPRRARVR